ncbi:MAG: hypothetical protein H6604_04400 [Flavobacteriales bacterium]|nr:hypothetical protein [Flavobacteriales bacterium]
MKKLPFLLLLVSILFSCTNSEKNATVNTENKTVSDKVSVLVEGVFPQNDEFQVFYSNSTEPNFNGDNSVYKKIVGQPCLQTIVFELPVKSIGNLRFDPGSNPNQTKITIKNISILKQGKIIVDGDNFEYLNYWGASNGLNFNEKDLNYVFTPIDETHDPIMNANEDFVNLLRSKLKNKPTAE